MDTPSPPANIHTPPTPLHGPQYDSPSRHSMRKSTRLNKESNSDRTPSPAVTASFDSEAPGELKRTPRGKRTNSQLSPPSSPIESGEMVATTRAALKRQTAEQSLVPPPGFSSLRTQALPTPVKTPNKRALASNAAASARILFPSQQPGSYGEQTATPSKRSKKIKKHVGFSLDDEEHGGIEIYTDSKDRIPEVDERDDNPFFVKDRTARKASNKRKREPELERQLERGIDEMDNDRGMVYVFRGKKVYRRFDGMNPATRTRGNDGSQSPLQAYAAPGGLDTLQGEDETETTLPARKHFTRSSIKPRRLFHSRSEDTSQIPGTTTDEEAVTDIEDPERHGLTASASRKLKESPQKLAAVKVAARSFEAPPSPFDSWPRRKSSRTMTGMKREGSDMQSGAKRAREST